MQSLISRLNQSRVFLFLYIFAAAALLSSCGQLPLLSNPVVPPTARNGQLVPVSVDLDPKNFASRDVIFRYGGQGIGSNQALTCRPLPGSSVLRCSTQIRFTRTGVYDYDFLYTYQLNRSDVEIMVPQPPGGTIRILPNPGSPGTGIVSGGDDTLFDPTAIVEVESPLNGSACVGDPSANRVSVNFGWQEVPGVRDEIGAYQVEIHRVGANCQPVNWTGVGQTDSVPGDCWIVDTNTNFHSEAQNMAQNTDYRWRVRATVNNNGAFTSTDFSPFQSFRTGGPETTAVQFLEPTQGDTVSLGADGSSLDVRWSDTRCPWIAADLDVYEDGNPIATINPVPPRPEDQPGADFRYQIGVHAGKTIRLVLALQTRFGPVPVSEITFQTVR